MTMPTLHTSRLVLRPFVRSDAAAVQRLAGAREVASTTLMIPHPYEDGMAETWIDGQAAAWESGEVLSLAIATEPDGLVGAIGLRITRQHQRAELGYWIGVPYWNRGYATEAASAVVAYGFTELGLHRVVGRHFPRNPASGRVLTKVGMTHEGTSREHVVRWGVFEDLECYGILESEWLASRTAASGPEPGAG